MVKVRFLKMKNYIVTTAFKTQKKFLIEAKSEEEAIRKATNYVLNNDNKKLYEKQKINDLKLTSEALNEEDIDTLRVIFFD